MLGFTVLAMSGTRNSGISTGAATRRLWRRVQKYPKSTQVLLFLRGRIFFSAYPGRYGGSSVFFVWIVGGSGPSGPRRSKLFQFIAVFHIQSVLSGAQKSSTGSDLRYTRCLDLQYPVRTGTPDPGFTGFTGSTRYGKSRIDPESEIYQ